MGGMMRIAIKIIVFIAFIVAVGAWADATKFLTNILYRFMKDEARRRSRIYSFLSVQLTVLLQWTAFYLLL
jgi:hypothetical protein